VVFGDTFTKRLHFELGNRNVLWSRLVRRLREDSALADRWRLDTRVSLAPVEALTIADIHAGGTLAPEIREKILRRAKESIPQLFSSVIADVQRRVLAMRWDLPWYDVLRPADVSEILRADFDELWTSSGCQVDVLIFTDLSVELNTILP
jgi:hypothetical protein